MKLAAAMPKRLIDRLLAAVDARLPDHLHGDPDALRVGRLVVGLGGVFAGISALFGLGHLLWGTIGLAVFAAVGAVFIGLAPVLLHRVRAPEFAGGYFSVVGWLIVAVLVVPSGGILAAGLAWICVPPLLALLVASKGVASKLLVASIGLVVVLGGLSAAGWETWLVPPGTGGTPMRVLVYGLLPVATTAIGWSYTSATQELRATVERRTDALALVLDNVGQGFLLVDKAGAVVGDHSRAMEDWFGAVRPGQPVWEVLYPSEPRAAAWMRLGWEMLAEGILPIEVCVAQLPATLRSGDAVLSIEYRAAGEQVLLVVSDTTDALRLREADEDLRQFASAFEKAMADPPGFAAFVGEVGGHFRALREGTGDWRRRLHTLKASLGMFGLVRLAHICHEIEDASTTADAPPSADVDRLELRWSAFEAQLGKARGSNSGAVSSAAYAALSAAIQRHAPYEELAQIVHGLSLEPARAPLARAAEYAKVIARSVGKEVEVAYDDGGVRLPAEAWGPVWSTLPHVIRNAVDHGIETPAVRVESGKPAVGRISISLGRTGSGLELRVTDDGQGVDWARVALRLEGDLPTYDALEAALFVDGVTTRDAPGEVSGRGVGLGAFREAVRSVGGDVRVRSVIGTGTTIIASFAGTAPHDECFPSSPAEAA